jgi:hypothetical protein
MSWAYIVGLILYGIGGGMIGHITYKVDGKDCGRYFWYGIIAILCFVCGGGFVGLL